MYIYVKTILITYELNKMKNKATQKYQKSITVSLLKQLSINSRIPLIIPYNPNL